jgi:hypothetical protein
MKVTKTASTVLRKIKRAFHFQDRLIFFFCARLDTQYVTPHLEFATQAQSPWSAGDREYLERVQKRAFRMQSRLKGTTYKDRLNGAHKS